MKVSVIIPTYNRERTIKKSIESVLKQDYGDIEVIVVDDCSTDNTCKVIEGIDDSRLRYIKLQKNSGACKARNVGIENAKGEYIAFQDSDDVWRENKLTIQLDTMKKANADIVVCFFQRINLRTGKKKRYDSQIPDGFVQYETLLKKSIASTQCMLIKSECLKTIRFDETLRKAQDWDLILNLSKKYKVYFLNKILVDVYLQEDSITRHKEDSLAAYKTIYNKHKETIQKNNKLISIWCRKFGIAKLVYGIISVDDFKNAFKYNPNIVNLSYYIMAKLGVIILIWKIKNFIIKE